MAAMYSGSVARTAEQGLQAAASEEQQCDNCAALAGVFCTKCQPVRNRAALDTQHPLQRSLLSTCCAARCLWQRIGCAAPLAGCCCTGNRRRCQAGFLCGCLSRLMLRCRPLCVARVPRQCARPTARTLRTAQERYSKACGCEP